MRTSNISVSTFLLLVAFSFSSFAQTGEKEKTTTLSVNKRMGATISPSVKTVNATPVATTNTVNANTDGPNVKPVEINATEKKTGTNRLSATSKPGKDNGINTTKPRRHITGEQKTVSSTQTISTSTQPVTAVQKKTPAAKR